jgi:hypothetical protein
MVCLQFWTKFLGLLNKDLSVTRHDYFRIRYGNTTVTRFAVADEIPIVFPTPEEFDFAHKLGSIFMPYATRQREVLFGDNPNNPPKRMIHYTNAEAALKIITSKRLWMRNTNSMADYREVQHGFDIFNQFFSVEAKVKAFTEVLDECAKGVALEAIQTFNASWNDIRFNTYISSMSEHQDHEDQYGRLSMWRGFGGNAPRVGIVLNIPWFSVGTTALNLLFSPIAYLTTTTAHEVLEEVIENIRKNCDYIRTVERSVLVRTVFMMLLAGVVCLKHAGFHEEREWRAIYAPKRWPSALMEYSTEVVAGVPQVIYKIPLDGSVSNHLADLDFARLFDRLIVGPTQYSWPMYDAFLDALTKAGVADPNKRLFASDIPIRT